MAARADRDQQGFSGGRASSDNPGGGAAGNGRTGGAGTNALASAGLGTQTGRLDRDQQADVGGRLSGTGETSGGKTTASGGAGTNALLGPDTPGNPDDEAPTMTRRVLASPPGGLSDNPSDADTYDKTGRLKTMGTGPYVADPSAGQIVGALTSVAPLGGTINTAEGVASRVLQGKSAFGDTYDGGGIGQAIDGMRGVSPGAVTGFTGNSVASSTNTRGARPSDDTTLMDRAGGAATAALLGDSPGGAGTDALFSDVALQDRRKPSLAGTSMLLKAA